MLNFVDRWIDRWEGVRNLTKAESLDMIAVRILPMLGENENQVAILLTSSIVSADFSEICKELSSRLPSRVTCVWAGNPCLYPESVRQITDCAGVVLLESAGKSKHAALERLTAYLKDCDKEILGFVLV